MTRELRSRLFNFLFFFGLLGLSLWYIFRDENLSQVFRYLSEVDIRFVIPAVGAVIAYILGESVILHYLMRSLGTSSRFSRCCMYSFIGFFYSAITPSASGGQPMQMVAMRCDSIPATVSVVVMAIITITYKAVLVVLGVGVLVLRPSCIMVYLQEVEPLMDIGLVLNVVVIALLLLVVFHPGTVRGAANMILRLIQKIHRFRNLQQITQRLNGSIGNYQGTAEFFRKNPRIIANVFVLTLLQRFFLFSVVWFTYMAYGLQGASPVVLTVLYGMISVAVDMLPLPGGMGISETLFLSIFQPLFGEALVLPGMIVCRGISYYTQLLISAFMTGVSHFVMKPQK